jgi:cellobiose phosphorylase
MTQESTPSTYGYFDDNAREYVITRPDTPSSWSNYLGSTEYGAIITNNAGGYSFHESAARGRFLRLRFNSVPLDQPGRYFYLRDNEDGDYWSSSWQPVGRDLKDYKSTCHHGTAYTKIDSSYKGIDTESTYFVPLGQKFEYWLLKVTNNSDKPRDLSVFSYCEFASHWNVIQDLINLQYTLYIVQADKEDNIFEVKHQHHLPEEDVIPEEPGSRSYSAWITLQGADLTGFDTSREAFLGGPYRQYSNPIAVEKGECSGSLAHGDTACGSMNTRITLQPGESRQMMIMLGVGRAKDAKPLVKEYGDYDRALIELDKVKKNWHSKIGNLVTKTPDVEFDHMVNVWNAYNALITFAWSRSASLVYNGERDGLGYRDTVQDILGVIHAIPEDAEKRLSLMISGQFSNGGGKPVVEPFLHNPGHEKPIPDREFRSDDCLWLFYTVPSYVAETGDMSYLERVIPFADKEEATVLGHLRRALEFSIRNSGKHGLPCGLLADWNDCLCLGNQGESTFAAFQLRYGLKTYSELAEYLGKADEAAWAKEKLEVLDKNLQEHVWDGEWFLRAFTEQGDVIGTHTAEEGSIFLNAQAWAIMSGAATKEQGEKIMEDVHERLFTPYGLMLCDPPFVKTGMDRVRAVLFNKNMKENGGIFCHPQSWGVIAETMLGHGDRAYEYYRAYMPSAYNDKADIRKSEPYVHAQSTHAKASRQFGKSSLPWLSGTASWSYFTATQYILGIRMEIPGLLIDPCIPTKWDGFTVQRTWRGKTFTVDVKNPDHVAKGVKQVKLGEKVWTESHIPFSEIEEGMTISVTLG